MTNPERTVETGTDELLGTVSEREATITLNRTQARNFLSDSSTPVLRTMIRQCGDDIEVDAIIITGAEDAFCAGGDVKSMGTSTTKADKTFEERWQIFVSDNAPSPEHSLR